MLDELAQTGVGSEEVFPDIRAPGHGVFLELTVEGVVHLLDQDTVRVASQEVIPLASPDDLDDVPAGAAEQAL